MLYTESFYKDMHIVKYLNQMYSQSNGKMEGLDCNLCWKFVLRSALSHVSSMVLIKRKLSHFMTFQLQFSEILGF